MAKFNGKKDKYLIMTGKNREIAEKMLKDVTEVMEKHNIRYWIDFGTLLGIVREGRLLPWDDDMDFSMDEKDRQKMHEIVMPEIKKRGYRIYTKYHHLENDDVLKKGEYRTFVVRNNRWKFFRGHVKIDIFVMYEKGDYLYWYEIGNKHRLPKKLVEKLDTIDFKGKAYYKPADHDSYLTYHYGDWREPKPDYTSEVDGLKTVSKNS